MVGETVISPRFSKIKITTENLFVHEIKNKNDHLNFILPFNFSPNRLKYLKTRKMLDLEDKYRYPVLSSMDYGWGQTELIKQKSGEEGQKRRGRVKIVDESFYRRNGIPFSHCSDML